MNAKRKKRIEKRFHELVVLHATGKATPAEEEKMRRYGRLRRSVLNVPRMMDSEFEWRAGQLLKYLKRLEWISNNPSLGCKQSMKPPKAVAGWLSSANNQEPEPR